MTDTATAMSDIEREYRATAREWLLANTDPLEQDLGFSTLHWMPRPEQEAAHHRANQMLQRRLYDGGYAGITIPQEYGGRGG